MPEDGEEKNQHALRGPIIYFSASIVNFGLAFFMNVLMANILGADGYGDFKYATNFVLILPALLGLGVNHSAARLIAQKRTGDGTGVAGAALLLGFGLSAVIIGLLFGVWAGLQRLDPDSPWAKTLEGLRFVFPFIGLFLLQRIVNSVYQGMGAMRRLALFDMLPYALTIIITGLAYTNGLNLGPPDVILIYMFANASVLIPRLIGAHTNLRSLCVSLKELVTDIRHNGLYIYVSSVLTTSASQVISLIFGASIGFEQYGYFALATSLAIGFRMVATSFSVARFRDSASRHYLRLGDLRLLVVVSVILYLIYILIIDWLFFLFYSSSFAPTLPYLNWLAAASLIFGVGEYFNRFLIAKGRTREVMHNSFFTGVVSVSAALALGFTFGLIGLVMATTMTSIVNLGLYLWRASDFFPPKTGASDRRA